VSENKPQSPTISPELAAWAEKFRGEQTTAEFSVERRADTLRQTEEFVKQARQQHNRISVEAFRHCFLPFFLGEQVAPEVTRGLPQPDLGHWIAIAGGPYNKVDLVDSAGNVVLTVPPAMDSETLDHSIHDKSASMYEGIATAREILTHSPHKANKHLEHLYAHELSRLVVKPLDIDHIIAWNKIYAYFDKPMIEFEGFDLQRLAHDREKEKAAKANPAAATTSQAAQDQDDGDFEDG